MLAREIEIPGLGQQESEPARIQYEIISAGGNTTALVPGFVDDEGDEVRKLIAQEIMAQSQVPAIEQVGFYDISNPLQPILIMAGGELCGNAIRSLSYLIALLTNRKVKAVEVIVKMKNKTMTVSAGVTETQNSWANIPIQLEMLKSGYQPAAFEVVFLEGIAHVVTSLPEEAVSMSLSQKEVFLKELALEILTQQGLVKTVPASGVMFIQRLEGVI